MVWFAPKQKEGKHIEKRGLGNNSSSSVVFHSPIIARRLPLPLAEKASLERKFVQADVLSCVLYGICMVQTQNGILLLPGHKKILPHPGLPGRPHVSISGF